MNEDKPQAVRQSNTSFFFDSDIFRAGRLLARRARPGGTVQEPARAIPVFRDCDVLVVGGGPAGTAAAVAAARTGAEVVLLERCNHLGGLSTGGLVIWIDRMTDWTGAQVIQGIANDLLDRLPRDAVAGPPRGLWGSADTATAAAVPAGPPPTTSTSQSRNTGIARAGSCTTPPGRARRASSRPARKMSESKKKDVLV